MMHSIPCGAQLLPFLLCLSCQCSHNKPVHEASLRRKWVEKTLADQVQWLLLYLDFFSLPLSGICDHSCFRFLFRTVAASSHVGDFWNR